MGAIVWIMSRESTFYVELSVIGDKVISCECPGDAGMTTLPDLHKRLLGVLKLGPAHDTIRCSTVHSHAHEHISTERHCTVTSHNLNLTTSMYTSNISTYTAYVL